MLYIAFTKEIHHLALCRYSRREGQGKYFPYSREACWAGVSQEASLAHTRGSAFQSKAAQSYRAGPSALSKLELTPAPSGRTVSASQDSSGKEEDHSDVKVCQRHTHIISSTNTSSRASRRRYQLLIGRREHTQDRKA